MRKIFDNSFPLRPDDAVPLVFTSGLCRQAHFRMPLYQYWCKKLNEIPRYHRKQWEFVYICQVLYERAMLFENATAVGFGVGKEPLVAYFASLGINTLATDLDLTQARDLGWVSTDQHSNDLASLNDRGLCNSEKFLQHTRFRNVDMNHVPKDLGSFDFCWSSCAFEHLGSIQKGLQFVIESARHLKPGGVAVHTTEYNVTSNEDTLDNNPAFVIFRKCDLEALALALHSLGYIVETIDFESGSDELERYVDLPPYLEAPHLRLQLAGQYTATSIGIIIHAPT